MFNFEFRTNSCIKIFYLCIILLGYTSNIILDREMQSWTPVLLFSLAKKKVIGGKAPSHTHSNNHVILIK